jgi:myo-inositol catabolism protein IolS
MERAILHGTDISVSRLSLGTWAFGNDPVWGAQDEKASIDTVSASLDHGIDFIDTAEGYADGRSEEVLGRALKGRRDRAIIATKVYSDRSREGVVRACEDNLKRLQTDYIDAYYIHWPNPEIPVAESMEGLDRLLQAGKIRSAGICNAGPVTLSELEQVKGKPVLSLHQIPFSLFWRACEFEVLPKTRALGATGVAYSVLAQGLLTGRYASAAEVPQGLHVTRFYGDGGHGEAGAETEVFAALVELRELAKAEGQSLADLAIQWALAQPGIDVVLTGARTPQEIEENAKALDRKASAQALARMTAISETVKAKLGPNPDMWMNAKQSRFR